MECRRTFLKKSAAGVLALAIPSFTGCRIDTLRPDAAFQGRKPGNACVLWYSQTGFTEKSGRRIADTLETMGITVMAGDIRSIDRKAAADCDLLVVGSPVFYYDTPDYVKQWIDALPDLEGKPVAAFVTFGGPEGNQHNAAYNILDHLSGKGGVALAMGTFRSMSTFPLSWPEEKQQLRDGLERFEKSMPHVDAYAAVVVRQMESGGGETFHKKLTMREISTYFGPVWWTKRMIQHHSIDTDRCVQCGTCAEKCPVDAIDPAAATVDTDACVLCFGCINNCPASAVRMISGNKQLVGFVEKMKL